MHRNTHFKIQKLKKNLVRGTAPSTLGGCAMGKGHSTRTTPSLSPFLNLTLDLIKSWICHCHIYPALFYVKKQCMQWKILLITYKSLYNSDKFQTPYHHMWKEFLNTTCTRYQVIQSIQIYRPYQIHKTTQYVSKRTNFSLHNCT